MKNLHFIVFGVCVLLGLILAGVAFMKKSSATEELQTAQIAGAASIPTNKDVQDAKKARNRFDDALEDTEKLLMSGKGDRLLQVGQTHSTVDSFYSNEASGAIQTLRERFDALAGEEKLPEELKKLNYTLIKPEGPRSRERTYWQKFEEEISGLGDASQIKAYQVRLKIMNEVCVICEQLVASGEYGNLGVRLVGFSFNFADPNVDATEPWQRYNFTVIVDCEPSFASALVSELTDPSERSAKPVKFDDKEYSRELFPVELVAMDAGQTERPMKVRYTIPLADRKALGIPEDMTAEDFGSSSEAKKLEEEWMASKRLHVPVRYAIQCNALALNKNWQAIKTEEEEQ